MLEDATALHEFFSAHPGEPGSVRAALGPRIRRARVVRLKGLNLEEFGRMIAEEMGRSRSFSNVTISNWETGRQEPSFEALVAISRLTRLPLRYFAGVGEMDDYPHIAWLSDGSCNVTRQMTDLLRQLGSLPEWEQELVVSQTISLLGDLHRLQPSP